MQVKVSAANRHDAKFLGSGEKLNMYMYEIQMEIIQLILPIKRVKKNHSEFPNNPALNLLPTLKSFEWLGSTVMSWRS